jgi:hypothetical protein
MKPLSPQTESLLANALSFCAVLIQGITHIALSFKDMFLPWLRRAGDTLRDGQQLIGLNSRETRDLNLTGYFGETSVRPGLLCNLPGSRRISPVAARSAWIK